MNDYEVNIKSFDELSLDEAYDYDKTWRRTIKSIYELPLEYHKQSLQDWEQLLPRHRTLTAPRHISQTRRTDISFLTDIGKRDTRFQNLRTEILFSRLENQPSFEFVRHLAVAKLERHISDIFNIIYNNYSCDKYAPNDTSIPHRMFRWTHHDFLERRKVLKIIWINVLQKNVSKQCLDKQKFQIDLEECLRFLKLIFKGVRTEDHDEDFDIMRDVIDCINDTYQFLSIELRLNKELAEHVTTMRLNIDKSIALTYNKSDQKHRDLLLHLETKLMDHHTFDPIELRYQLGYYRSKVNQAADHWNGLNSKYEQQIQYYKELLKTETYCSQCALNTYYTEIEKFKTRFNEFSAKYDREYESIDNMINYKKLFLEKLREQRQFCLEQIQRFHEEIEHLRQRELAEKEKAAKHELEQQQKMEEAKHMKKQKNRKTKK